ncbi:MurR/RpiR family transcriptional regulator [Burkholderia guangdongensis]|uniref:MurR/RpiR family transcriptional regulator n=1 Tax=Burkholderia guangdongensis TaxID=1792500 RepID=UPI0015CDA0E7|nr:MurR/RpiR family transcriptional regulator [Burkholderia guangdongensis]
MPISSQSFVHRVRSQLESLPATERQLADFLLEFPGELASYTGNELAELAGVSPATVSRFIRRIGYRNYEAARRHAREERESGSPLFQATADGGATTDPVAVHFQQSQANLAATFGRLDGRQLVEIARTIARADHVLIFGSRASHGFAVYLRWQLIQVVPRVTAIPGAGETLGEHTAALGRNDCVIVFGTRRQTRQMSAVIQAAVRARAKLLFISDRSSPDCADATWSLQCDCRGPGRLDDHAAVMALCNVIATRVIEASGTAGRKRLAAIELAHETFEEL